MTPSPRTRVRSALLALLAALGAVPAAAVSARAAGAAGQPGSGGASLPGSGGATPGGLDPTTPPAPAPPSKSRKGKWLRGVAVTEYWPAPESWFVGRLVSVPGLGAKHRVDWLYSAIGVSMDGEGIGLDGQLYHIVATGDAGWVTSAGRPTAPGTGGWSGGPPYWRAGGYWRGHGGQVTYPLQSGGWSNGRGGRYLPLHGVTFAAGASLPLGYYQSIAVDPSVIPLGSRVYIPAYRGDGHGGWFVAQDTGGAIIGRHVDVYRPPPAAATDPGLDLTDARVYVIPPHR
jgi:3D (Asp-Asp-Asp) domain-containing protein